MEPSLNGKTILITGGTSRLGSCFVKEALGRGAKVYFTFHRSKDEAGNLERQGACGFRLDLSQTAEIDRFVREYKDRAGALNVLIHNAAAVRDGLLHNLNEDDWDHVMDVGLKAPYYLTKKLLSLLFKSSPAKVFMLTSRAAYCGTAGVANYAAAKAGLIGLVKSLAKELGRKNILVNAVNPGFMKSAMTRDLKEEIIERNMAANPLGRFSDPEEVARFLAFLCSDQMEQVTGQVFHYEGRSIPY